jgi:hypothetical protein
MKLDAELDQWREQWQSSSEAPVLLGLRKRVARQSLYMRIMLMADILVTAVIGGATVVLAIRDPRPATAILAAATWLFIAVAWIFGLSNRKDAWSPSASTMAAFLDLSIRRCRGNLRAITFGAILYIVEMAFCLSWVHHESNSLSSTLIIVIALITIILAALLIIYRKKKRADLTYLLTLQRDLTASE